MDTAAQVQARTRQAVRSQATLIHRVGAGTTSRPDVPHVMASKSARSAPRRCGLVHCDQTSCGLMNSRGSMWAAC